MVGVGGFEMRAWNGFLVFRSRGIQTCCAADRRRLRLRLSPQVVESTLLKSSSFSDLLSLTFFLCCARQPGYFHHRSAFQQMVPVLDRLLLASCGSVQGLIHRLQGVGFLPTPPSLLLLLRTLWLGRMFPPALEAYHLLSSHCSTPHTFSRNILLDVLFKMGRVHLALQVLHQTHSPNFFTFSIAVSNLCKLANFTDIGDVLRRMLRMRYYLNPRTFSSVIHCFCKLGRLRETFQLLGLMIALGIPPSVNIWSILIDGFCKSGNVVTADHLFEKMVQSGCSPNVVTCTSLIKGLMKSRMPDKALRLLGIMESKGCAPDLVLCNVLIDTLSKMGRYDDALDVYFSLPARNLVPDSYTFCSVMSAVCLSRQFDLLPLLISGVSIRADLVVSNALLSYFCKAGYPSGAVELYDDMISRGFTPDGYSYAGLLTGLCGMGRLSEAVNVYNAIVGHGFCVDPHIHTIILHGLLSSGEFHKAIRLYRKAALQMYPLDVVSYTATIQGLLGCGKFQEACDLYSQMKEADVNPNVYTYNLMLSGFCRVRDIGMVREILHEMLDQCIEVDCRAFYVVKKFLLRSCSTPASFNLFIEMCHSDSVPDKAMGAVLLRGLADGVILGGNCIDAQDVDSPCSDYMSDVAVAMC